MLSQAFAVISAEHDYCVLIDSFFFQKSHEAPDLFIGERDLTVVGLCRIFPGIGLGRMIGSVRVVEVHPQEKLPLRILRPLVFFEPVQRRIGDKVARALHLVEIRFVQAIEVEVVVVKIESLIQSKARIQDCGGDHRSRLIPGLFEDGSERGLKRAKLVAAEIMHPTEHGIGSGQNRGVRGQGYGNDCEGAVETRSVGSEGVDVGRLDLFVSVAADMVGAQRVDRNEDDIQSGLGGRLRGRMKWYKGRQDENQSTKRRCHR